MRFPFYHPTPPRGVYDGQPFPWPKANIWSKITLSWVTPIFKIALGRTIEDDDPWQVQPDAECRHVAEKIINAHQPRIPPSRRMAGYRPPAPRNQLSGRPSTLPQDRAIIFDHPTSTDSYADRAYFTETLVEAAGNCQLLLNQLDNAVRTSRPPTQFRYPSDRPATQHAASTLRKTVFEPLRNMMTVYEDAEDLPNDEAIADKLAATGSRMQTKAEMVQMYGKRKTAKVLAGKLALEDGQAYNMSLIRACYDANTFQFWLGSGMLLLGFAIRMIIPIITQVIIDDILAVQARIAGDDPARPASLGAIIGLSIGFLALMILCNLLTVHSARVSAILGSKTRAALVYIISKKSMLLSHKSRLKFSAGKINALISADASYAEMACTEAGLIVMCPPVIIIGCALIIKTIGVAGLAGVGVIALTAPIQKLLFGAMIKYRMNHLNALDARTQLLTETVRHLHAIKLFAYGPLFEKRIADLRMEEAEWVKKMSIVFALADIIGTCMPALAAVVSFTIYTATGNTLSLSQAFATLQFFNFVQQPLTWFPRIFSTLANILNASRRLQELIIAEERLADIDIIPQARYAIRVNAGFTHEDAPVEAAESVTSSRRRDKVKAKVTELLMITDKDTKQVDDPNGDPQDEGKDEMSDTSSVAQKDPFRLAHISLKIPHGCLVCIVGRVGSGKSTLLSGLLGETRSTANGIIEFGGSIAYVPQEAWVQSGSIRHNITFAAPSDESRLSEVVRACGLTEDLARLSHGIDTSVGERGISLSGGQKSRVCLARAAYSDAPIVLLDDPLSAVDASVGHALLNNCILRGPLASRTRVLVTHHLDVLPKADLILVMDSEGSVGRIAQQGTYQARGPFRSLMMEYGSTTARVVPSTRESQVPRDRLTSHEQQKADAPGSPTQAAETMELVEERESGSVAFATYAFWLGNMGWAVWPILLGLAYVVSTGVSIANILWLAYWQQDEFEGLSQGAYQGIYAGIAVAYAATGAACNIALIIWVVRASIKSCLTAIGRVMGAPMWFLDRTPTGRIVSRLTNDIEQMDTSLAFLLNRVIDAFTQPANRDVKRTDAVLRSKVYSNFAEQLNGLSVIRAFQKTEHFELQLEKSVDHQNRFTYLRQYMLGDSGIPAAFLIYGVLQRETINAAQLAVALTLILQSSYVLLDIVPMLAMLEQDMNSVERVKHYCTLEQEAPATKSSDPPLGHWPTRGAISFRDIHLQYRPDLPTVLKGLSFDVREGEKVGVIGRTGAGKSSLVQSLYRTVELAKGSICIDGVNLRDLGLDTLRSRLSLIPQESFLFEGTVRQNIDPDGKHSDAKLNDALSLIHSSPSASESIRDKFRLETAVQADGGNFSAGEKQLLSLIRAMVRDCKVLILDEATSSVDLETDGLIQRIIQTQFADTTLLSIAHRLQTVAYYDKILVMDAGKVAEYDSPLRLYDKPGSIFRRLCDVKGITRQGLLDIRADAARIDLRSRRGV